MNDLVTWPMVAMALIAFLTTTVTSVLTYLKSRENNAIGKEVAELADRGLRATHEGNRQIAEVAEVQQTMNGGPEREELKALAAETAIEVAKELGQAILGRIDGIRTDLQNHERLDDQRHADVIAHLDGGRQEPR